MYKITPPKEHVTDIRKRLQVRSIEEKQAERMQKHRLPKLALYSKPTGKINKRLSQRETDQFLDLFSNTPTNTSSMWVTDGRSVVL
jgi:hypothetical protein